MQAQNEQGGTPAYHAYIPLILRLTTGWIYFSALWRRVALSNKLDPESAGYIGEKFNNFLPNALGIQPMIRYLLEDPDLLHANMVAFTIIEGIVGLFLIFGFMTRISGIGATALALGILLGAGWLGTTCLDEWQIGVFGLITGASLAFSGGGHFSLDSWLVRRKPELNDKKWFRRLFSGDLERDTGPSTMRRITIGAAFLLFGITLATNQAFHGGVWGELHNPSKHPHLMLEDARFEDGAVRFQVMRDKGIDTYGSFVLEARLEGANGALFHRWDQEALRTLPDPAIENHYIAEVSTAPHGLKFPVGALAELSLPLDPDRELPEGLRLVLEDVSGDSWSVPVASGAD